MVQEVRAKVFLSSTTVGLKEIRNIAFEAIKAAGCDPIGMEDFGAVADIPDSVCQDKIAESHLYVGLFGWRYGSRPPGSDESYTEREYRYAQLRGLPCLIFLLDESLCRAELSAPPEPPKFRDKQESLRRAVRAETTKSISDPGQLRTEIARSLGNALHEEAWAAKAVFGRREFLRHLKRELTTDKLNLALIGLPGIGKSKLAGVFRDAPPDGYRVWFQQLPEMSGAAARADITGLTTNDLAALANSALGRAASDKTMPQLADLLEDQLRDGMPTLVVLDNVWPAHVDSLSSLYQRLTEYKYASFLITSRFAEVPGLLAGGAERRIFTRPVPTLSVEHGLELLTWTVAELIGKSSMDARPDLHLLREALRPLARHADGYPVMLQILAGLVVRQGHSLAHLRRCAADIEHELVEVRARLQHSPGTDAELHASAAYHAALEQVLGHWLQPDGLSGPARDLLAMCAVLPPQPASYSRAMLKLHWQAAGEAALEGWGSHREQAPALYDLTGPEGPRERAFDRQLGYLCSTQLLRDAEQPVGRINRCQDAEDVLPEEHYALHAIVAGFFREHLLDPGDSTKLHETSEQALRAQLEEGPLPNMFGMYAMEGTRWQGRVSLWLYHLAHLAHVQPVDARARMASLYLDAFWWWGYYAPFPFCDLLISNWERVVVPPEMADDHVSFVHYLRVLNEQYPRGWRKAGSDMRPVRRALTGIAALIGVDVEASPATYDQDEDRLHLQGLLRTFLGDCAFYESSQRPLSEAAFSEALRWYQDTLASFAHRHQELGSYTDEWNEAWMLFEIADLHASAGKFDEAEKFCCRAEARERERVQRARERGESAYVMEELLGNVARVRADIAESRSDLAEESRQRARAVVHVYAAQVRPAQTMPCDSVPGRYEGGPDTYTNSVYREMTDRAVFRVADLITGGRRDEAREMTRLLASCWRRQDLPETAGILSAAAAAAQSPRPEKLRDALFPPPFDPQRDDLDNYIENGLRLAAEAEQSLL